MTARPRRSLRFILAATLAAAAVVPTLGVGVAALAFVLRQARADVFARNVQVARAVSGEVSRFIEAQLVYVQAVVLEADELAGDRGDGDFDALLAVHVRANPAVTSLALVDASGRVAHVAPADPDALRIDLSAMPALRDARTRREPAWSSASISMRTGEPAVTVVVPGRTCTAIAWLDLGALARTVERSRVAHRGEVAVVDRDGTFIAHPEGRLVREQVNVGDLAIVHDALLGGDETGEFELGGRRYLGSTAPVPLTRWAVLISVPRDVAYADLSRLQWVVVAILLGVTGLAVLGGFLLARRITRPVEALSHDTRRITSGAWDLPPAAPVGGFREVEELSERFGAMAAAVRSREAELARREREFRTLVSTQVVGVLRTRMNGEILFANEAAARLFGAASPDALRGRFTVEFYADPASRAELVAELSAHGRVTSEMAVRALDGRQRTVLVSIAREDEDLLTGMMLDVTERLEAAAEKRRLEQQLFHAQKLEAVGRLAGGVAHDFNNLLTAIVGYGSLLQESLPPGGDQECVDGILLSARRAAQLTQSLLAYSRRQLLQPRPVDVGEVARGVAGLVRRLIGEDVTLEVNIPVGELTAVADPGQLEQVLVNLCTNSRDAMRGGGRISITASAAELGAPEAEALGVAPGRHVRLRVTDDGVGMDAATLSRVFEPFFTTKPAGKGTGLGLAIVYGIVKQHGGHVGVESAPGQGTAVELLLPASTGPAAPVAERQAPVALSARGTETILLAEDEPLVRRALVTALQRAGYGIIEAGDGEEAIRKFREQPGAIDLCLLDVVMPIRNGREAAEAIKQLRPGARILLASGYTADVLADRGHLALGAELITKPITPRELLTRVREMLDRPG